METVTNLIRENDPLGYESMWSPQERQRVRLVVLRAAREGVPSIHLLRQPMAAALIVLLLVLVAGTAIIPQLRLSPALAQASVRFEIRLAEEIPAPRLQPATGAGGTTIHLHESAVVTNIDIQGARVIRGSRSGFDVQLMFTPKGAEKISRATRAHVGKPMAILIDGKVVATPTLRGAVASSALINGEFSRVDAERIANGMIGR